MCFTASSDDAKPIYIVNINDYDRWVADEGKEFTAWLNSIGFQTKPGSFTILPQDGKNIAGALFITSGDFWEPGILPSVLPSGNYQIDGSNLNLQNICLVWGLGSYRFENYIAPSDRKLPKLVWPDSVDQKETNALIEGIYLVRNLINRPANDLNPMRLAAEAESLAKKHGADFNCVRDKDLEKDFPAVYAVGKAGPSPCLIDIKWGNPDHKKVTLVGKGVTFDTGGLNLKSAPYMRIMKKDMGGAAHVLGLAHIIMSMELPINLRVIIPAVENGVSLDATRPSDIIKTRKGISVEIGNTDAEGRVILADALALASEENPDLIIDYATLTGAARAALGPDIPAMFSNNDSLADELLNCGKKVQDQLWRMPLWQAYKPLIKPKYADIANESKTGDAGAIMAALFLQEFVACEKWIHIDTTAWNYSDRPGRAEGGEAMGIRAFYELIKTN